MNIIQEKIKERFDEYNTHTANIDFYVNRIKEKISLVIENMSCNELETKTNIKISVPVMTDDVGNENKILKKICEKLSEEGIHVCRSSFYDSGFHFTLWVCEFTGREKKFIQVCEYYENNFFLSIGSVIFPYIFLFLFVSILKLDPILDIILCLIIIISYTILYTFISTKVKNRIRRILEEKRK